MGLETATYISGLVSTNPAASDQKSAGDDHIRLIKSTLLSTFPNVTGAITASHTELNILDGVTASTAELNILDGVTASTAELNIMDGVTVTAADINSVTGKAALNSPALTGTPTAPTAAPGTNTTQIATTEFATQLAMQAALPAQPGGSAVYQLVTQNGSASWTKASSGSSIYSALQFGGF